MLDWDLSVVPTVTCVVCLQEEKPPEKKDETEQPKKEEEKKEDKKEEEKKEEAKKEEEPKKEEPKPGEDLICLLTLSTTREMSTHSTELQQITRQHTVVNMMSAKTYKELPAELRSGG